MLRKIIEYHGAGYEKFKAFLKEASDKINIAKEYSSVRDFVLSQSKIFMWKDKGQPEYDDNK